MQKFWHHSVVVLSHLAYTQESHAESSVVTTTTGASST